jgi:WD40 repeat protein
MRVLLLAVLTFFASVQSDLPVAFAAPGKQAPGKPTSSKVMPKERVPSKVETRKAQNPLAKPQLIVQVGSAGLISCAALSPDGRTVVTGNSHGTLRVWNFDTGELVRVIENRQPGLAELTFTADGELVSASSHGPIKFWNVKTGSAREFEVKNGTRIKTALFDGKALYFNTRESLQVLDSKGTLLRTLPKISNQRQVAISSDEKWYVDGSWEKLQLRDIQSGQVTAILLDGQARLSNVAISPDGHYVATAHEKGGDDYNVTLWSVKEKRSIKTISIADAGRHLNFDADGKMLSAGAARIEVPTLEVISWIKLGAKEDKWVIGRSIQSAFSSDKKRAVLLGTSGFRLIDATTGQVLITKRNQRTQPLTATVSHDASLFAVGTTIPPYGLGGATYLWDLKSFSLRHSFTYGRKHTSVALSADNKLLATGDFYDMNSSGDVFVWNIEPQAHKTIEVGPLAQLLQTGQPLPNQEAVTHFGGFGGVQKLAFSPDGQKLAALRNGRLQIQYKGNPQPVTIGDNWEEATTFQWNVNNTEIVIAQPQKALLKTWPASGGAAINTITMERETRPIDEYSTQKQPEPISILAFSPDAKWVLGKGWQNRQPHLYLWNATTGKRERMLPIQGDNHVAAFSPDGKKFAVGNSSGEIFVFSLEGSSLQSIKNAHEEPVTSIIWSSDGKKLVSTGADGLTQWRDAHKGTLKAVFQIIRETDTQLLDGTGKLTRFTSPEWIAYTPEGFYTGSANVNSYLRWNTAGMLFPAEKYAGQFNKPKAVEDALK